MERKLELVIEQLQRISQGDPVRIVCKAFCSMFTRASLHLLETLGRNSSARRVRPRKPIIKVIIQLKNNYFFAK